VDESSLHYKGSTISSAISSWCYSPIRRLASSIIKVFKIVALFGWDITASESLYPQFSNPFLMLKPNSSIGLVLFSKSSLRQAVGHIGWNARHRRSQHKTMQINIWTREISAKGSARWTSHRISNGKYMFPERNKRHHNRKYYNRNHRPTIS
jgi:hypothetical protein